MEASRERSGLHRGTPSAKWLWIAFSTHAELEAWQQAGCFKHPVCSVSDAQSSAHVRETPRDQPAHVTLGLIEYLRLGYRQTLIADDDDDD